MRLALPPLLLALACAHQPDVPRGKAFWMQLKDSKFAVPPGESADAILRDAEALVESPDPELRDDVGYGLSVAWAYRSRPTSPAVLAAYAERLRQRMVRFDDRSTNAVLSRSFSALELSMIAVADTKERVFDDAQYGALVDAAAQSLEQEWDLRGYDATLGWIHATAHVADLVKYLARNERMTVDQQVRLQKALVARLNRGGAFAWGEDERLAQALRLFVIRPDGDLAELDRWIADLPARWKRLWEKQPLDRDEFARLTNARQTLSAMHTLLSAQGEPSQQLIAFRDRVLEVLVKMS